MNSNILKTEVQDFINSSLHKNISKIIFKGSPFPKIAIQELANQIQAKEKCQKKLPTWFQTKNIYYPPKVSIEQTSSEITALYKAKLIQGNSLIDICGGFGIDTFYFSKEIASITYCELNSELPPIVKHNYEQLGVDNVTIVNDNGIDYLKNSSETFDCVYTDPSRRSDSKEKVFLLKDCSPNIPDNLDILFSKSNNILIKVSPILDISSTLKELKYTKEIHVIAVNNEVKELLFLLEKGYNKQTCIKTINFQKEKLQTFNFTLGNTEINIQYTNPKQYLYEPNVAILKSGAFKEITHEFSVKKLHKHSHLYSSDTLIEDFPGRKFIVKEVIPYNKKKLIKMLPTKKANITIRNFPKTVAQIRKETKINDGGNIYLFFTTLEDESKVVIITEKK